MNETLRKTLKNCAGSLVRTLLVFVCAWLVKEGVITDDQTGVIVESGTPVALGVIGVIGTLAWSFWQKRHSNKKVDDALAAPPEMSREEFERARATGAVPGTAPLAALFLSSALLLPQLACGGAPSREKLVKVAGYGVQLEALIEANWTLPDTLADQGVISPERRDQVKTIFASARGHIQTFNAGMRDVLAAEKPNVATLLPAVAALVADVRQLSAGVQSEAYKKTLAAIEISLRAIANYFAVARAEAHSRGLTDRRLARAAGVTYDPRAVLLVVEYSRAG